MIGRSSNCNWDSAIIRQYTRTNKSLAIRTSDDASQGTAGVVGRSQVATSGKAVVRKLDSIIGSVNDHLVEVEVTKLRDIGAISEKGLMRGPPTVLVVDEKACIAYRLQIVFTFREQFSRALSDFNLSGIPTSVK